MLEKKTHLYDKSAFWLKFTCCDLWSVVIYLHSVVNDNIYFQSYSDNVLICGKYKREAQVRVK